MSVLIKDVDKELYRKFKAKAVMRGIKVGTALSLAIEKWLQDVDVSSDEEIIRIRNNETFNNLLPKLLRDHDKDWVVISEGEQLGVFKSQKEAFEAMESNNLYGKVNIVAQITGTKKRVVRLGVRRKSYT
ncbi:MAG: hypothetical protein ACXAD7_20095 [Candidatus Kariarchaeaceae archaeon]|jgi:hypothetical protein